MSRRTTKRRRRNRSNSRTTAAASTNSRGRIGRPQLGRNLANGGQEEEGQDETPQTEIVRMGSCSQVPYANLTWENGGGNREQDLKELPMNELLIRLDHPAYVSPPNQYNTELFGPVIVDIGLYVDGIFDLDPAENTFSMEGYIDLVWCDSRAAFDSSSNHYYNNRRTYLETDAAKELEKIWWPDLTFVNAVSKRDIENQELIIDTDGTVEYREKFGVKLASDFDMDRFPFDKQVLVSEIESFAWNASVVQFHVEQDLVGFSEDFDIPEYTLTGVDEHLEISQEARDRHPFSDLVTELYVERTPTYYVTKVIIPLTLIVCISWAVFWMNCWELGDRMAISFTGVLTSVAYQFVVADSLPRHVYNTFLDNYVLLCFFNLILTVVINVVVHSGHTKGYCKEAMFVDKVCRFLFPVMFALGSLFLAGAQLITDAIPPGGCLAVTLATLVSVTILVVYFVFQTKKKRTIRKRTSLVATTKENHIIDTSCSGTDLQLTSRDFSCPLYPDDLSC